MSQAERPVWAQLVRQVEASLNFILQTVEGLWKIVEWGSAATLNVVIYQDEFDSSVQAGEKRLKAKRLLLYPKFEMVGSKLELWPGERKD